MQGQSRPLRPDRSEDRSEMCPQSGYRDSARRLHGNAPRRGHQPGRTGGAGGLEPPSLRRGVQGLHRQGADQSSIAEIAMSLGFVSHSHFTRHFRKVTGTTPSRFRRDRR
ncbi:MAG: helix-turn-helix domain-containing protein [Rhodospirillales bacterium]|nr:MAG: helix-turn-helix domain-containing protein [Rhodospirillales bacterium]